MNIPNQNPQIIIHISAEIGTSVILENPFYANQYVSLGSFIGGGFSYISHNSSLQHTTVGRYCSIGKSVEVLPKHPTDLLSTSPAFYGMDGLFFHPFRLESEDVFFEPFSHTVKGSLND